jgi:O-antigen/teichoic acid export membrane protein
MAGQNKQLAINMLAQVVVFLVQMGINFLLTPFIVKSLGVEAYGFVGLSNNIIGYLQLATVALNSMAGRFITIEYHKGNLEQANKYFSSVFYSNVVISAVLAIISIILLVFLEYVIHIPVNLVADVKWLFALLCLNSLLTLVFNVYIVSPFIKNRLDVTSVRNLVSNLIKAAVILVLFGFFSSHLWYIGCSTLICGIYLIIANVKIKDKLTPELGVNLRYFDFVKVKTLLASGVWNLIGKLGDLLQRGLDLLFANWFINAAAMGILSITTQIPFIILSVLGLFTSSFAPSLTKDFAKGNLNEMLNEVYKSIRILSISILVPIAILYIYGDVFYKLWMPTQNSLLLQKLTICGTFALLVTSPLDGFWNVFTVTNKIKGSSIFMIINSLVVFLTVLLGLLLTEDITTKMFIIAAVRSLYGVIRGIVFLPIYGAYCMNLKRTFFYKPIIKSLFGVLVTLGICWMLRLLYVPDNWLGFFISSLFVAIVSCCIGSILILTKNDKKFIMEKVIKRRK